jgi:hypothetical protein
MIIIKNRPLAGFFSNFNAVIDWCWYSELSGEPIYILWNGWDRDGINIFEELFNQKYKFEPSDKNNDGYYQGSSFRINRVDQLRQQIVGDMYDEYKGWFYCGGKIYLNPKFGKLRAVLYNAYAKYLTLKPNIISFADFSKKTLGVQYRFILHYFQNSELNLPLSARLSNEQYHEMCLNQIERTFESGGFEQIYLGCDQHGFLELCKIKFQDKLIYVNHQRTFGLEDWTRKTSSYLDGSSISSITDGGFRKGWIKTESLLDEYVYVLTDTINLSRCHYFIGSPSNVTFGILTFNPNLQFEIFDHLKDIYTG